MSYPVLARLSGVSLPTVQRMLSGRDPGARFSKVEAVARALRAEVGFRKGPTPNEVRLERAREKARRLVGLVQGTSGLEGQAVRDADIQMMVEDTTRKLLAGSRRTLWSD
jgi:hypothetical protein